MPKPAKPWFVAHRYGWGWFPATWQGWTVLLVWTVLVLAGALGLNAWPTIHWLWLPFLLVMVFLLAAVCWTTGERPRWRWGTTDEPDSTGDPEESEP